MLLRDHASAIVKRLAEETQSSSRVQGLDSKAIGEGASISEEHVAAVHVQVRIESGFDLAQIMSEYIALRSCVLRLWRESDPQGFAGGALEINRFAEAIDEKLTAGVLYYESREARYRDLFLGILGHDLRNPINAILLSASALAEQEISERHLGAVSRIISSARRLTNMVNDTLDFARGRLGSPMPIARARMNLSRAVSEVIDEVEAANAGSSMEFEAIGDLNGMWDASRLKQMVSNLLINALQHGTGKNVTVKAEGEDNFVVLQVHNEGPPIPPDLLPTIFDPLVRGDNQDMTSLGLGLFIVNEIVSAHNGIVTVASSDAGTDFAVRLPRATP